MLFRMFAACLLGVFSLLAGDFGKMGATALFDANTTHGKVRYPSLKIGETGSIVRWFDKEHSSIIARGVVESVEKDYAIMQFDLFDSLSQKAMPIPKIPPRSGDEVYLKYFYDRALLIAPNQEIYQKIIQSYKGTTWVHPDLFLAQIMLDGNFAPKKSDFRKFCNQYSVGVVYFINGTKGEVRDCQTFAVVKSDYVTGKIKAKDTIKPFFSRFETVESSFLAVASEDVNDYYDYYDRLLKNEGQEMSIIGTVFEFFEGL